MTTLGPQNIGNIASANHASDSGNGWKYAGKFGPRFLQPATEKSAALGLVCRKTSRLIYAPIAWLS